MLLHVATGNLVRDAVKAERRGANQKWAACRPTWQLDRGPHDETRRRFSSSNVVIQRLYRRRE